MSDAKLLYRMHARQRMAERGITPRQVRAVIETGEVIEERHPEGRPLPTRLLLGWVEERPLHVLLAEDTGAGRRYVITVYEPDEDTWEAGFRTRRHAP